MYRILAKEELASGIARFWIDAPRIARKRQAGQFVIVRLHEGGERIPLTITDADPAAGTIALIVQEVGKTTRNLNSRSPGDSILDVVGPLGRPTRIDPGRHVCCVAGGVGAAVLLPIARAVHDAAGRVTVVAGARTRHLVILERELRTVADDYRVCTDDGSYGHRGVVTDALRDLLAGSGPRIEHVVAAGPVGMMRAVCEATRPLGVPTDVSLNPIMIDGTGMCGGCRVSVGGQVKFACVDGPEFSGPEVNFDELEARLTAFCALEQVAATLVAAREA